MNEARTIDPVWGDVPQSDEMSKRYRELVRIHEREAAAKIVLAKMLEEEWQTIKRINRERERVEVVPANDGRGKPVEDSRMPELLKRRLRHDMAARGF